jgi:hypothetical protein
MTFTITLWGMLVCPINYGISTGLTTGYECESGGGQSCFGGLK